ncbi:MAG: DUF1822 family protein [Cyanobacteria bacterium P01_A01_bin.84]
MLLPEAFIALIEEQPELFTPEDREKLARQQWSEDLDELENQVYGCLSSKEDVYETALKRLSFRDKDRVNYKQFDLIDTVNVYEKISERDNLNYAIAQYTSALNVYTESDNPEKWADTQLRLANIFIQNVEEDRSKNLEQAIQLYQNALRIYTKQKFPLLWAMAQYNLSIAYCERIKGDRAENLKRAIEYLENSLLIYTQRDFPLEWTRAKVKRNLVVAHSRRIKSDGEKNMDDLSNNFPSSVEVYVPPEAYQQALKFASEQTTISKAKQVFVNTIAIYAVHSYLEAIQIDSKLEKGNSWQAGQRTIFDLSDLAVSNYGRLECRPVEPNDSTMTLPSFTEPNCRGYIAVRLPVSITDSTDIPKIDKVYLLGFIKASEIPEAAETIPLSSLDSLESMLEDICLIESWTELSQQNDPVVKALQQVLGTREDEFINRLEQFSKTEDIDDRSEIAVDFLREERVVSTRKNGNKTEINTISTTPSELLELVEQLWNKLGI